MSIRVSYYEVMSEDVVYQNWWSKLLFKEKFEKQFFIPVPQSSLENALFKSIEKWKFGGKFEHIQIIKPIFIIGLPRSGTTLLYNLLCAHDSSAFITNSINACPESICSIEWLRKKLNLNIRGERFLADSVSTDFGSPSEPATLWGKWFGRDAVSIVWNEQRIQDLPAEKVDEIKLDIRKIISCFGSGEKRFICKYPVIQTELRIVQDLFPDAKFVHIVRDSRQAANSLAKLYHLVNNQIKKINHPTIKYLIPYPRLSTLPGYIEKYGPESIETTARVWQDTVNLVHETARSLNCFYELKYEDLLKNPEIELKNLFRFCELEWPKKNNKNFQNEFEKIGKIHHKNEYSQFDLIEKITEPTLKKLGYL